LVGQIKDGKVFEVGTSYPDILGNGYLLEFLHAKESNREVLRLLIPDKNGQFEDEIFKAQFTITGLI
jgi:hypothetical protein